MRICIDLDGVICELKREGQTYAELKPVSGAREKIHALRAAGHTVIVHTARHMKTCDGNVGAVIARQGLVTLRWLEEHGIEYDEIYFGKPYAHVYLDDNAVRFAGWDDIADDGSSFPRHREAEAVSKLEGALK